MSLIKSRVGFPAKGSPTQRAADGGYVPRFRAGFWREASSILKADPALPTTANADRWATLSLTRL